MERKYNLAPSLVIQNTISLYNECVTMKELVHKKNYQIASIKGRPVLNWIKSQDLRQRKEKDNFFSLKNSFISIGIFVELGGGVDDALVWRCDWRC